MRFFKINLRNPVKKYFIFFNYRTTLSPQLGAQHPIVVNGYKNKKQCIKSAIMDAGVVAGVGNIYACESLFLAGIHPLTPAGMLTPDDISRLVLAIKEILTRAIDMGGSTLRDFFASDGLPGYFAQTLHVYGREKAPCLVCKNPISNIKITGRSTYFCGTCQQIQYF